MRARRLGALVLWGAFSAFLLAGCNGLPGSGGGGAPTGGIVAQVTGPSTNGLSLPAGTRASHIPSPSDVTSVHVIVSAEDISPSIEQDFLPSDVDAEIADVPAGTGRTLTVQGLDSGGKAIFTGEATDITVVAGEVTDVGTIILSICPGSLPEQAQCLVDQGKAALENLISSKTETTFADAMDGIVAWFGNALTLDPLNEEAAFYQALFTLPRFVDSQATTTILGDLGLDSVRTELDKTAPFDPATEPIFGGTDSYVDLSFADGYGYVFGELPASLEEGRHLMGSIGSSFSSKINVTDPDGTAVELEFDYTEVKLLEALAAIEETAFYAPTIWHYTGFDSFISANSTRDPTTGQVIDDITDAEVDSYFAGSSEPLSLNQTGVDNLKGAFSKAFSAVADAIDSLLNNESDDQSNDVIVMDEENPEYDDKPEVNRFIATLIADIARDLSASFASSSQTSVEVSVPAGVITDFGSCDPRAAETTDPFPYNQPAGNPATTAGLNVATATVTDTAGTDPPAVTTDPNGNDTYYFTFTVDASNGGVNLSMFTRNTTEKDNYSFGKLSYSTDGTNFINWDSDFSGMGEDGNFGLSVSKDMIDATIQTNPLPQSATLTFLVGVESYGPAPGVFKFYAWDDTVAGVPIFLKGNGRNFAVKVYRVTESVGLGNIFQAMGAMPGLTDRSTLDSLNDSLTVNTADVEDAIHSVLPSATVTITDQAGNAVGTTMDLFQDHVGVDATLTRTDVTSEYPAAPSSFCAYPWQLNASYDTEGGFDL